MKGAREKFDAFIPGRGRPRWSGLTSTAAILSRTD
jgi:hypothetical protein